MYVLHSYGMVLSCGSYVTTQACPTPLVYRWLTISYERDFITGALAVSSVAMDAPSYESLSAWTQ